jgi:GntR family transcriptional regulator
MLSAVATDSESTPVATVRRENRGIPLYQQVEQLIRYKITTRRYAPGQQIPSEHELRRELNVSRVTVREALRELVRENLLIKVPGKGTFVSVDAPSGLPPIKYTGFLEELYERVKHLVVKSVVADRVPVPDKVRALLHLDPGDTEVIQIRRLRHIGTEPFSFTVNHVPVAIGSRIDAEALRTVPLNTLLERDLGIPIVRAHETVEAAPADPEIAAQLDIPVLYPVMHVTRVMFTEGDRAFEVVETYYRADKYQYSVSLQRVKRDGKWTWDPAPTPGEPVVAT